METGMEWLTVKEAAELLGYTPQHVRRLIIAGDLTGQKRGRDWFVTRSSLLGFQERVGPEGKKRGPKPNN